MLLGIYFFLSIRTVAIAIAMIIATTAIARYMIMSELETDDDAVEGGRWGKSSLDEKLWWPSA